MSLKPEGFLVTNFIRIKNWKGIDTTGVSEFSRFNSCKLALWCDLFWRSFTRLSPHNNTLFLYKIHFCVSKSFRTLRRALNLTFLFSEIGYEVAMRVFFLLFGLVISGTVQRIFITSSFMLGGIDPRMVKNTRKDMPKRNRKVLVIRCSGVLKPKICEGYHLLGTAWMKCCTLHNFRF